MRLVPAKQDAQSNGSRQHKQQGADNPLHVQTSHLVSFGAGRDDAKKSDMVQPNQSSRGYFMPTEEACFGRRMFRQLCVEGVDEVYRSRR